MEFAQKRRIDKVAEVLDGDTPWSIEPPDDLQLKISDWLARDIPAPEFMLGEVLSTTSRVIVIGPTGLGKTKLGLAMAVSIAAEIAFLHWSAPSKPYCVLYIDGEMSRRQLKKRIGDAVLEIGADPETLLVLSKEDVEDMPPLNTEAGQMWMDRFVEKYGPFDLVIFDNVQALLLGDMKDEEPWSAVLPWVLSLTRRSIGQLWFHHTGHDESHGYGSKTREWKMDTVVLMERIPNTPKGELWFSLKFTKARERNPDNLADFDEVTLKLIDGKWQVGEAVAREKTGRPPKKQMLAYEALNSLAARHGSPLPPAWGLPAGLVSVPVATFRDELLSRGIVDKEGKNPRARTTEIIDGLKVRGYAAERDDRIWPIVKER